MELFKCSVCGLIIEGETVPSVCPKCGAPAEMIAKLSKEDADKIYMSDSTNDIHTRLIDLAAQMIKLCEEGIKINLDPPCVSVFSKTKDMSWIIKQLSKAEIASHIGKGKF